MVASAAACCSVLRCGRKPFCSFRRRGVITGAMRLRSMRSKSFASVAMRAMYLHPAGVERFPPDFGIITSFVVVNSGGTVPVDRQLFISDSRYVLSSGSLRSSLGMRSGPGALWFPSLRSAV